MTALEVQLASLGIAALSMRLEFENTQAVARQQREVLRRYAERVDVLALRAAELNAVEAAFKNQSIPVKRDCTQAARAVSVADVRTIKSWKSPPRAVVLVLEATAILRPELLTL